MIVYATVVHSLTLKYDYEQGSYILVSVQVYYEIGVKFYSLLLSLRTNNRGDKLNLIDTTLRWEDWM